LRAEIKDKDLIHAVILSLASPAHKGEEVSHFMRCV
jgi:hypothetical protein